MTLKVLHVCPLWFPVARDSPGGIETLLADLLAELAKLGCENTLLANAGSETDAELLPVIEGNLWDDMESGAVWEYAPYELHQVMMALQRADEFDVIHSHIGWSAYLLSALEGISERVLHTQHNEVTRDVEWFVRRHPDFRLAAVSEFQAQKLREQGAERCRVIPNGIDFAKFPFSPQGGERLVYLGRMEQEKGPDIAARVARECGRPLTIAGPMTDDEFFEEQVEPLLGDGIEYVGPVDHGQKARLLGSAACVLMPSRWDEPFGLVAIEAMACGTPVVALANGALPELVLPEINGFLAGDEGGLAALVPQAEHLDRVAIREWAERRYALSTVAARYRELYVEIATEASLKRGERAPALHGSLREVIR